MNIEDLLHRLRELEEFRHDDHSVAGDAIYCIERMWTLLSDIRAAGRVNGDCAKRLISLLGG